MFSKACEHGIKAIIYIATQSLENRRVKIGDVANNTGTPEAFTAKILGQLTKKGVIESHTGPYGGFEISASKIKEVKLIDIVDALDGDTIFNGCALGLNECDHTAPCPMHERFVKIRSDLKKMLHSTSIYDLATNLKSGNSILIR